MPAYGKMFGRKSLGGSLGAKWGGTSPRTKPPHALASGPGMAGRSKSPTTVPGYNPPPTTGPGVPNPRPGPATGPGLPKPLPPPTGPNAMTAQPRPVAPDGSGNFQPNAYDPQQQQPGAQGGQWDWDNPYPTPTPRPVAPDGSGNFQPGFGDEHGHYNPGGSEPNVGVGPGPAQSYGSVAQPQQINQPSQTDPRQTSGGWYDPKIEKPTFEPPAPYEDIRTWSMRDPEGYSQAKTEYADQMRKWNKQNAPTPQEREGQPAPAPDEDEGPAYEGPGPGHPNAGRVSQGRSGGLTDDQMKRWNDTKRENQRRSDAASEQERNWRRQQQHNEERGTRRRRRRNSVHVERQQAAERRRRQGGQRPRRQGTYQDALRRFREQEQERRNYHGTPVVLNPGGAPWTGYRGGQNNFYQPQQQYSQWSY